MASSPTRRSLEMLREQGWTCAIVERWNQFAKVRQDLYGFIDLLCFKDEITLAVQTTSGPHVANRREKILAIKAARDWVSGTIFRQLAIHGWAKRGPRGKRKTWECRIVQIQPEDFV